MEHSAAVLSKTLVSWAEGLFATRYPMLITRNAEILILYNPRLLYLKNSAVDSNDSCELFRQYYIIRYLDDTAS